jgi:hypothetical protein
VIAVTKRGLEPIKHQEKLARLLHEH